MNHSDLAYQSIKQKIITLELKPLAVIDEQALMESLRLGRTPIREALHRLAMENLVIIAPRRGMFVAGISVTDLQKIFELRVQIEGYCAQLAAQRATDAQITQMEQVLDRLEPIPRTDTQELMSMDQSLHQMLYTSADNKFLADELNRLLALSLRLWYLAVDKVGDLKDSVDEHRLVVDALKARDSALAETLMQHHIARFQELIRAAL